MSSTENEVLKKLVIGGIRAFLKGKQNINWVRYYVKVAKLPKQKLTQILTEQQPTADPARYNELVQTCQNQRFL